ncbi:PVC-type heme-binding CxxCH protein [Verrucomicrobiales bacterium BCK34]|nr:PVC-type heme-binding CxxCH protein [Verrucomicrobiales bacterium BCK34]
MNWTPHTLRLVSIGFFIGATGWLHAQDTSVAGNDQVADIIKNYQGRGALSDGSSPTPPEEALKEFTVREGFEVELVASEPVIGQPLHISWDSKGRMWVTQYLQYQFPAGLKIVEYDNHLRAQFDKMPEPPPHGAKGADKITVFEDTTGDGLYDSHRDVITGLNIATSCVTGAGGIWVTNAPYLLFYPDADGDAVPDGDPEVMLSGFGIEDTHAVANSLKWGPDGWLYGATGSTTTGSVNDPATGETVEWQGQAIWRFHPATKEFEIFAEGGGNTFSLEIDSAGRVFSGTNNGNTRGMYYPQGSYGRKSWGKHGPLTNPYAFGYFEHMKHEGDDRRFAQAFCIYEGGLFPDSWDHKIIAANSLHNIVWVSEIQPDGSTFKTVDEEPLMQSEDRWFRPVFCGVGPDGCVYIADWYDTRLSHVRPVDDWHKNSGRIYRVKPTGTKPKVTHGDLSKVGIDELLKAHDDPNWVVRKRAVNELGERKWERADIEKIVNHYPSIDEARAKSKAGLIERSSQDIRPFVFSYMLFSRGNSDAGLRWNIRIQGDLAASWNMNGADEGNRDNKALRDEFEAAYSGLTLEEPDLAMRAQLAATAKRLPVSSAIETIQRLLKYDEDATDPHIPLLIWWAIEAHAEEGRKEIEALAADPETWKSKIFREVVAERLARRYCMDGGDANFLSAAKLLETAPDADAKKRLMTGLQLAFQGAPIPELPEALSTQMDAYESEGGGNTLVLAIQRGDKEALKKALTVVANNASDPVERIELAKLFGEVNDPVVIGTLLKLITLDQHSTLKKVALQSLANYDDDKIGTTILYRLGSTLPAEHDVRSTAHRVLAGRLAWAKPFLEKVDLAHVKARNVSPDVVQLLAQHKDPEINAAIKKHWPDQLAGSSEENQLEMARIQKAVAAGGGNAEAGKVHFAARCAVCHKLFGEGMPVGPELTGYERNNLEFWIPAIVDPSLELREGFLYYVATMKDGRKIIGMLKEQSPQNVTLRDFAGQETLLDRAGMESLEASPVSLMPPSLLAGMSDEELRDLFAYLMKDAK